MNEQVDKIPCSRCGEMILTSTALRTGGLCMPCASGSRESMDAAKRRNIEEREKRAIEERARAPLNARRGNGENLRFEEFSHLDDPSYKIFRAALDTVFDKGNGRDEHVERLSEECRLVYLLWCFNGEIYNGGFDQFFTNSAGNYSAEVLKGLEIIGATHAHALLQRAMRWFPNGLPATDRKARWQQYEVFGERDDFQREMDQLDGEYYDDADDFYRLIAKYVTEHPGAMIAR